MVCQARGWGEHEQGSLSSGLGQAQAGVVELELDMGSRLGRAKASVTKLGAGAGIGSGCLAQGWGRHWKELEAWASMGTGL